MKNKALLFASNGVMFREILHDDLSVVRCCGLKIGDKGEINCANNVSFIKGDAHGEFNKNHVSHLEVYVYSTLVFKGYGIYYSSRHTAPYIFAEIEGEVFKIDIQGRLEEHLTVIKDCE